MPTCSWPACHCTHARPNRNSLFLPQRCLQHLLLHRAIPHLCPKHHLARLGPPGKCHQRVASRTCWRKHSSLRREIVAAPSPDSAPPKLAPTMRAVQAKSPNLTALATCLLFGISQWRRRHRVGSNPQLALSLWYMRAALCTGTSLQPRITSAAIGPFSRLRISCTPLRRSLHSCDLRGDTCCCDRPPWAHARRNTMMWPRLQQLMAPQPALDSASSQQGLEHDKHATTNWAAWICRSCSLTGWMKEFSAAPDS